MNYTAYHVHSDYSLLDSTTDFHKYIELAKQLGQTALSFTEHGTIRGWVSKKMACDEAGIKYIHGVEAYLTESHTEKVRDNYHTVLLARNYQGVLELNRLVSMSTDDVHKYYVGRLSFEEFLSISPNVIKISACLASPLNKLSISHPYYERLARHYDYYEIQPHNCDEQISYNRHLAQLSAMYGKPLIAGTDAHNLNAYYAECRAVLTDAKHKSYGDEDSFDLTYKSYDELIDAFREQNAIPESMWMEAIANTNVMADSVQPFELDTSLKYPILYGSAEKDREVFIENVYSSLEKKLEAGIIPRSQEAAFRSALEEEIRVFTKIEMCGFMQSMSEIIRWCHDHGIETGPARGSVGGSRVAYVTDVTDLNPETWNTVFSRFCNEDRKEVGDIDIDVIDSDRPQIFRYIIDRFGANKTAFVPACGTLQDKATIEETVRGLRHRWARQHADDPAQIEYEKLCKAERKNGGKISSHTKGLDPNPYKMSLSDEIKAAYEKSETRCRRDYPEIMYYFDGMFGTRVSQSVHPAGIVISPVTLMDNYGTFYKDDDIVLQIDMEEVHEVSLVKYDLLVLRNIKIIREACQYAGIKYPKTHEIDWTDPAVWDDMLSSPVGIFQMEGEYAFKLLKDFEPKSIADMSLVTACIRPSGASYRNELIAHHTHLNPSPIIDELLSENNGFLVYQEDTIMFLQNICGLSGSDADNIRRAIGRKDKERLDKAMPKILEGYCSKSTQPRSVAEAEAKEFIQIIEDSASYQFGKNHSIGYCLIGYLCAWLRHYYPHEFITALLNNAANDEDIKGGTQLAREYGIKITPPKFGVATDQYMFDKAGGTISKGVSSVKYLNKKVPSELYDLYHRKKPDSFVDCLLRIDKETECDDRQLTNLIKIGYFSEYGNITELLRIYDIYKYFNRGEAKKIKKDKLKDGVLSDIVRTYSTDLNAKGEHLKTYTIANMPELLKACEKHILGLGLPEMDIRQRIANQMELLGYIDVTTNNAADRRKLLVLDIYELKGGSGVWGVAVTTRSIGTGKEARLTIRKEVFDSKPLRKLDVIYGADLYKNKKGYWYLNSYEVLA